MAINSDNITDEKGRLWLFITPHDKVLFRDGRPFTAGQDTRATSASVLPPPSTVSGALRTYIGFEVFNGDFKDLGDAFGSPIQFWGPFLGISAERDSKASLTAYFPAPLDILTPPCDPVTRGDCSGSWDKPSPYQDNKKEAVNLSSILPKNDLVSVQQVNRPRGIGTSNINNWILPWNAHSAELESRSGDYVPIDVLVNWIKGENIEGKKAENTFLSCREKEIASEQPLKRWLPKQNTFVQVRINPSSRTVWSEKGGLYAVEYHEYPMETGFIVGLEQKSLPDDIEQKSLPDDKWIKIVDHFTEVRHGIMKIGGEGRLAEFEVLSKNPLTCLEKQVEKISSSLQNQPCKLLLLTPTIFEKGWMPMPPFDVVGGIIGKPQKIGGWDLKNNKPKPLQNAVPAGSIYYLPASTGIDLSKHSLTHVAKGNLGSLGFGLTVCTELKAL